MGRFYWRDLLDLKAVPDLAWWDKTTWQKSQEPACLSAAVCCCRGGGHGERCVEDVLHALSCCFIACVTKSVSWHFSLPLIFFLSVCGTLSFLAPPTSVPPLYSVFLPSWLCVSLLPFLFSPSLLGSGAKVGWQNEASRAEGDLKAGKLFTWRLELPSVCVFAGLTLPVSQEAVCDLELCVFVCVGHYECAACEQTSLCHPVDGQTLSRL